MHRVGLNIPENAPLAYRPEETGTTGRNERHALRKSGRTHLNGMDFTIHELVFRRCTLYSLLREGHRVPCAVDVSISQKSNR